MTTPMRFSPWILSDRREAFGAWMPLAFVGVILAVTIGFLAWSMNRGFDISDEGFYLQASRYPMELVFWPNAAHHLTGLMFRLVGYDVAWFRCLGLLILIGSGAVIGAGVVAAARAFLSAPLPRRGAWLLLLMAAGGALVFYIIFLRTPSYNLMNAALINLLGGAALYLGALGQAERAGVWKRVWLGGGIGVLLGLDWLVKFPSSVVMAVMAIGFVWLVSGARRRCWWAMLGVAGGTALCGGVFFAWVQPMGAWYAMFADGVRALMLNQSHHGLADIWRYLLEVKALLLVCILDIGWGIGVLLIGLGLTRRPVARWRLPPWGLDLLLSAVLLGVAAQAVRFGAFYGGSNHWTQALRFYFDWMGLMGGMLVLAGMRWETPRGWLCRLRDRWRLLAAVGFLLPLPLVAALGTGIPITNGALFCLAPWFCVMGVMAWDLGAKRRLPLAAGLAVSIAAAAAGGQIFTAGYGDPYRLRGGMGAQRYPVNLGSPATTILVDDATRDFWRQLAGACAQAGFRSGDDMLSFAAASGIDYALGAVSLGVPFLLRDYPGSKQFNELVVSKADPNRLRRAWIVEIESHRKFMPDWSGYGIRFPEQYALCGQFRWPASGDAIRLWKPLGRERAEEARAERQ